MNIGVDVGRSSVKACSGIDKIIFESFIGEARELQIKLE